jgi:magnesium chelatase family protein
VQAYDRGGLSARGHDRVLRVARTIADLAGRDAVALDDVLQALALRTRDAGPADDAAAA